MFLFFAVRVFAYIRINSYFYCILIPVGSIFMLKFQSSPFLTSFISEQQLKACDHGELADGGVGERRLSSGRRR